ncbi:MAG: amidohydrolase [Lautropia sp.]
MKPPTRYRPPPGACDCHVHVFGDPSRFPFASDRRYTPGIASVASLDALHASLGIARTVIVQPSPYGTDNACTLDAVERMHGRARAVAVVDPDIADDALDEMHRRGVRGVRLNLETAGVRDPAAAGRALRTIASRVHPWHWHVQVFADIAVVAALETDIRSLPTPLVVDHFGKTDAALGPDHPPFRTLLGLVADGFAYVKLSAPHRVSSAPDAEGAGALAKALLAANDERLIWGTDWPHPGGARVDAAAIEAFEDIDDARAIERLSHWIADDRRLHRILVENPARLYDFPTA